MPKTARARSRSKISWKPYTEAKSKKRVKLAIVVLVGLLLLVVVGKVTTTLSALNKPLSPDSRVDLVRSYSWDGQSNLNLIFKSDGIQILSADPINNQITVVKLPADIYVNTAMGFGNWPIGSVYDLGQSEKDKIGVLLLQKTLESIFAIPIDGYIITNQGIASLPAEEFISKIHNNPVAGLSYLGEIKTDLTSLEFLKLVLMIRKVRSDQIHLIDLGQSPITRSVLLPDGSRALGIDQAKLDQYLGSQFGDLRVEQQEARVGIFNTTDHLGLAEAASRLVTNLGGRVIFTSNSQNHRQKTVVLGNPSYTKQRLEQIFAPSCLLSSDPACSPDSSKIDYSRADITIFLGEDYYLLFNSREF